MTIHGHIKAKLKDAGFTTREAKAVIASTQARSSQTNGDLNRIWDHDVSIAHPAVILTVLEDTFATARIWATAFLPDRKITLETKN